MRELFYARHGETEDLVSGYRSRPETVLTRPKGWGEARRAGKLLLEHNIQPSLIVCSELPRALQSARAVADVIGYDPERIVPEKLLNERDWGQATGVLNTEIEQRWPAGFDTVPGAEHTEALQERADRTVAWLKELDEDIVFVMGHGTVGRAIMRGFEDRPYTDEYNSERGVLNNGQIVQLYPQPTRIL
jgi:broad specificity phosphatase PhoE